MQFPRSLSENNAITTPSRHLGLGESGRFIILWFYLPDCLQIERMFTLWHKLPQVKTCECEWRCFPDQGPSTHLQGQNLGQFEFCARGAVHCRTNALLQGIRPSESGPGVQPSQHQGLSSCCRGYVQKGQKNQAQVLVRFWWRE